MNFKKCHGHARGYLTKIEDNIAFKNELDVWRSANANIKVIYTVTACEPKDMNCVRGRINKDLLRKTAADIEERIFYIFGPPRMVETMKNICIESNCTEENMKTESFIGY